MWSMRPQNSNEQRALGFLVMVQLNAEANKPEHIQRTILYIIMKWWDKNETMESGFAVPEPCHLIVATVASHQAKSIFFFVFDKNHFHLRPQYSHVSSSVYGSQCGWCLPLMIWFSSWFIFSPLWNYACEPIINGGGRVKSHTHALEQGGRADNMARRERERETETATERAEQKKKQTTLNSRNKIIKKFKTQQRKQAATE